MKLNRLGIFSILSSFLITANILSLLNVTTFYINTIISFIALVLIPGSLIMLILKLRNLSFWENLLFIVGFSISFSEFGGLLINQFFPIIGINKPLSFYPLLVGFDVYFIVLFILAWIRTNKIEILIPRLNFAWKQLIFYTIPLFFPILSIFGAISINNEGSNILTMLMLGGIAVYIILLTLLKKYVPSSIFPYSIYLIGLSLLLMTSIRGWYITGHDIQREYYVFQLTKLHQIWDINFYRDAYNASLSITILPTLFSNLLRVSDAYVYKIIFQIIFALSPVTVFFILNKYVNKMFAFLSAFYFMSFPTFFNDMPMLNRQEIGFIFFGLILYISLVSNIQIKVRQLLFILFGISIVVSHYSTNYVTLILLSALYFSSLVIKIPIFKSTTLYFEKRFKSDFYHKFTNNTFINGMLLMVLFIFTIFWNTQFTKTSNYVGDVFSKVINSVFIQSKEDSKSIDVSYSIFSSKKPDPNKLLQKYINETIKEAKQKQEGSFYNENAYEKYKTYPLDQLPLPLTFIGKQLDQYNIPIFKFHSLSRQLAAILMQLLVFIGIIGLLFIKKKKTNDIQYIILCVSGIFLLALVIVLPSISIEYGLLRLFQQLLFLLSLPIVMATSILFIFLKGSKRIYAITLFAVILFLTLTGFISYITGGYYPQMTLDNKGLYYDAYYTHKEDVYSALWLEKNRKIDAPIQSDLSGSAKLLTYGNIFALKEIFPPTIRKKSYVYLTISNLKNSIVSIEANTLIFNSPIDFLSQNKNLIYNNGSNRIYK